MAAPAPTRDPLLPAPSSRHSRRQSQRVIVQRAGRSPSKPRVARGCIWPAHRAYRRPALAHQHDALCRMTTPRRTVRRQHCNEGWTVTTTPNADADEVEADLDLMVFSGVAQDFLEYPQPHFARMPRPPTVAHDARCCPDDDASGSRRGAPKCRDLLLRHGGRASRYGAPTHPPADRPSRASQIPEATRSAVRAETDGEARTADTPAGERACRPIRRSRELRLHQRVRHPASVDHLSATVRAPVGRPATIARVQREDATTRGGHFRGAARSQERQREGRLRLFREDHRGASIVTCAR